MDYVSRDDGCDECGFAAERWTDQDVRTTLGAARPLWDGYLIDLPDALGARRPNPTTWSIVEYADHTRESLFGNHFLLDSAVLTPGIDLGEAPSRPLTDEVPDLDLARALDGIDREATAFARRLNELTPADLGAVALLDGEAHDGHRTARHAVHEVQHHLHDVGRIRVALGDRPASATGRVAHLHVSHGGVPKHAVDHLDIGWQGAAGDRQNDRRHHGRPFQAICLWSADVLGALAAEGHPIGPGLAGENVTVAGLDWASLRPGLILQVGGARLEISSYATPCQKNKAWFADGDWTRIDENRYPGWARLYGTVLAAGRVETGEPVEVEPA